MNCQSLSYQFVLILLIVFHTSYLFSQTSNINSLTSLSEKIYLQTDSKVYTTDEIVWFKAIVCNAADHLPTELSGVLYVELITSNESIIEKKLIKLVKGVGEGFFFLDQSYSVGPYLIRAYTEWNKNFGPDFIFKEYIQVFSPAKQETADPFGKVSLIENRDNTSKLNVSFNPFAIDSLHKKEITLFVAIDKKQDTLTIKKNRDDDYLFDYTIPKESQFVTFQIKTNNQISNLKKIALDEDYLDLQFFPESGELVNGIPSQVGFKALDYNGKGIIVEGEIVNAEGEVITLFKSNELGMGVFSLVVPDFQTKYYARRKIEVNGERLVKLYPLPEVAAKGNVLSVQRRGVIIYINATSNYLLNDSITIQGSCTGSIYYNLEALLTNGKLTVALPANKLPEGIFAFTMVDNSMTPVAERLFFNERPESRLQILSELHKDTFEQREQTELDIEITNNEGNPVNANLSVLVLNKEQKGEIQDSRNNILSYFLLNSELKGEIENPGFYFRNDSSKLKDLDVLMLTQGWRKYKYSKPLNKDNFLFQPEPKLTLSGTVGGAIFSKKKKQVGLTMLTFGKNKSAHTQTTDSLGRFSFNLNDEFGQNLNILIQSNNKSGKKKDYTLTLDKKESPKVNFDHTLLVENVDSIVQILVEKNKERKIIKDAYPISSGNIMIEEVTVEAYHLTPERKMVVEKYGMPDEVIEGEVIEEKEMEWAFGLYSVLQFRFPGKVHVVRGRSGNLWAYVKRSQMTLVIIDGIPVRPYEYHIIPHIPPSEVKSFEILEDAKNFPNLYCEVFPSGCFYAPAWGDIIAIYTHAGRGIFGAYKTDGIMKAAVPVFSTPREFYTPKYENLKPEDWLMPDIRALVHWEPILTTNSNGQAACSFYNADNTGKMQVVIEAISENGEIGYQELFYEVEKRK